MVPNGLALYTPYSRAGRVAKVALEWGLRLPGVASLLPGKVAVVPAPLTALLPFLQTTLGRHDLLFSVACGTPGRHRKLTVQIVDPTGTALGFLKVPASPDAASRIRHEAWVLKSVGAELQDAVPRVLGFVEVGETPALLTAPVPGRVGPAAMSDYHIEFLKRLHGLHPRQEDGDSVVDRAEQQAVRAACFDVGPWRDGLRWARERLRGEPVITGWVHGDFAPWNTRVSAQGLMVIDWEAARENTPIVWDAMHFSVQVCALLGHPWQPEAVRALCPDVPENVWGGLLAVYLITSAAEVLWEGSPDQRRALAFRRRALEQLMR